MTRIFRERITQQMGKNIKHKNGYVVNPKDNVFDFITPDLYQRDLKEGAGHELEGHFNALYSSSALCVNSFAMVKKQIAGVKFFEFKNFTSARFEKKVCTGLGGTPPHLDFFFETDSDFVGLESKFLEPLKKTTAKFAKSYFSDKNKFTELKNLMEKYNKYCGHLDVAQLLKHSMGIMNNCKDKKPILIYVYWLPENYSKSKYADYSALEEELKTFASDLNNILDFRYYTYNEIWKEISKNKNLKDYIEQVRARYSLSIL